MSYLTYRHDPCILGWGIVLACHEYYHTGGEPHLNDAQYEAYVTLTLEGWGGLTDELKVLLGGASELRSTGYHVKPDSAQLARARQVHALTWANIDGKIDQRYAEAYRLAREPVETALDDEFV